MTEPHIENNGRIDIFNDAYFETALPRRKSDDSPLWERLNWKGEICYFINMDDPDGVQIFIRSSVDTHTGISNDTGADSIRVWLCRNYEPEGFLSISFQVFRVSGWEQRLMGRLGELRKLRQKAGNCSVCGKPRSIKKAKKNNANKGRLFASHCNAPKEFVWLTEPSQHPA